MDIRSRLKHQPQQVSSSHTNYSTRVQLWRRYKFKLSFINKVWREHVSFIEKFRICLHSHTLNIRKTELKDSQNKYARFISSSTISPFASSFLPLAVLLDFVSSIAPTPSLTFLSVQFLHIFSFFSFLSLVTFCCQFNFSPFLWGQNCSQLIVVFHLVGIEE